ncbi:hypothetical protein DACRYDRAFT_112179 [Dacryopinax primogenitus]|uniref:Uncharacterized protein n=1 Tax=Dacryopinax primogenitus (strain DJM 731) TaxID=1858805 RepID=M5FQZ8_DACPD|nr:uncharacterized protein DACRYDRAFT_112179 [Dacryopinax primogenitus]EJT97234.1 hypothetical protein DACRYDRAFT_112179 [Dacryopinax primogenitus]
MSLPAEEPRLGQEELEPELQQQHQEEEEEEEKEEEEEDWEQEWQMHDSEGEGEGETSGIEELDEEIDLKSRMIADNLLAEDEKILTTFYTKMNGHCTNVQYNTLNFTYPNIIIYQSFLSFKLNMLMWKEQLPFLHIEPGKIPTHLR